jgi:thioredoxin 1
LPHSKVFISACKVRAPTLEAVAEEQAGNLTVVKVDIDENPELATRFNIQSIPTLIVFEGGEAKKTLKGLLPKRALLDELAPFLAKAEAVVS